MAIGPRCSTGGTNSSNVTSQAMTASGWTNAGVAGISGTAPVAGDLVIYHIGLELVGLVGVSGASQTADTGHPYLFVDNVLNGNEGQFLAIRRWTGGETAPTFAWTSGATKVEWNAVAVAPVKNQALLDWSSGTGLSGVGGGSMGFKGTATQSTTHTITAATCGTGNSADLDLIFSFYTTTNTGSFAYTAPTGWTALTASTVSTASVMAATIAYKQSVSGTSSPAADTATFGGFASAVQSLHLLVYDNNNPASKQLELLQAIKIAAYL